MGVSLSGSWVQPASKEENEERRGLFLGPLLRGVLEDSHVKLSTPLGARAQQKKNKERRSLDSFMISGFSQGKKRRTKQKREGEENLLEEVTSLTRATRI